MRTIKCLLLVSALILTTGTVTYASDVNDMTIPELLKAYQSLESENKNLQAENATLRKQLIALLEDTSTTSGSAASESEKAEPTQKQPDAPAAQNTAADPDQPLFEEVNSTCMVYGEDADRTYEMVVELVNTSDVPLFIHAKSFDLEDADGHLLQTDTFISTAPDVILPGEHGFIYNQFGSSIDVDTPTEDIVFIPNYTITEAQKAPHDYAVTDISFKKDPISYTMFGKVQNDTTEPDMNVFASVIYFDKDGNCLGIAGTDVYDIGPGASQSFEITSMGIQETFDPDKIDSYTLYMREAAYQ